MSLANRMQQHWNEVKIFMKKEWPRFSGTTLQSINGNFDRFLFYLKDNYNNFPLEEAIALQKIQNFLNKLENLPE